MIRKPYKIYLQVKVILGHDLFSHKLSMCQIWHGYVKQSKDKKVVDWTRTMSKTNKFDLEVKAMVILGSFMF